MQTRLLRTSQIVSQTVSGIASLTCWNASRFANANRITNCDFNRIKIVSLERSNVSQLADTNRISEQIASLADANRITGCEGEISPGAKLDALCREYARAHSERVGGSSEYQRILQTQEQISTAPRSTMIDTVVPYNESVRQQK